MRKTRLPIRNVDEKQIDAQTEEEETGGWTDDAAREREELDQKYFAAVRQHDARHGRAKG